MCYFGATEKIHTKDITFQNWCQPPRVTHYFPLCLTHEYNSHETPSWCSLTVMDCFVSSVYCNIEGELCGIRVNSLARRQNGRDFADDIIRYRNWYQYWGHCCLINDLGSSPQPEGFCGELPRSLMRQQWPKLRYQFLFYHDETKLMMNKQILSI